MGHKNLNYTNRAAAVIAEPLNAVGRIKKMYGAGKSADKGGALLVMLYDNFPMSIVSSKNSHSNAEPLWVEIDSLAVPLFVSSLSKVGGSGAKAAKAIILFDDFEREESVEQLVGKVIYMEPEFHEVVEEDDDELEGLNLWIGYELKDRITGRTGVVSEFYDYTGNPVLGVEFDGQEVLVPAADGLIEVVSDRRKKLETELPEGIFTL